MKGILFKPDMHQAIREGKKTVTRRVIKPQPLECVAELKEHSGIKGYWVPYLADKWMVNSNQGSHKNDCGYYPRYQVGEVVYIKEAWATEKQYDHLSPRDVPRTATIFYPFDGVGEWPINLSIGKLRSPMFLMEWKARDFIKITNVRVERLQEITVEECIKEGHPSQGYPHMNGTEWQRSHVLAWYKNLWDSINKEFLWGSNPWIWRYEFEKSRPSKGLETQE